MGLFPDHLIMTPLQKHGARNVTEYRAMQRRFISSGRVAAPALNWRDPWLSLEKPAVLVDSGAWKVVCATEGCYNRPIVDPVAHVALCFECGAMFEGLSQPDEAVEITARLIKRPVARRNWAPGESLAQLDAENVVLGVA